MPKPGSRTVARLIVLLFLLAGLALAIFLATLDLNHYRSEISSTLSRAFNRPVSFTRIELSLIHGLAIDCQNLEVAASKQDPSSLKADHLYLKVSLLPLLKGDLTLREVILDRPQLFLDLTADQQGQGLQQPDRHSGLTAQLGEIHLHHGIIDLLVPTKSGPAQFIFKELDLMLQERDDNRLGVDFSSRLHLGDNESMLALQGEIDGPAWPDPRENRVDLEFLGRGLPLAELHKFTDKTDLRLTGQTDLSLRIAGTISHGLTIGIDASADRASYSYNGSQPLPVGRWQLQGVWQQAAGGAQHFRNITLGHRDLHLAGNLAVETGHLQADLNLHQIPLDSVVRLLPDTLYPATIEPQLPQGQLSITASLPRIQLENLTWPDLLKQASGNAELTDFSWQPPGMPLIGQGSGNVELGQGKLTIRQLQAIWQNRPQTLTGTIDLTGQRPAYNLLARLDPPLIETGQLLAEKSGRQITLAGSAPSELTLKGTREKPRLAIRTSLDNLSGSFGDWYEKPAELPGELSLQLAMDANSWALNDSYLQLDDQKLAVKATGQADGRFTLGLKSHDFKLDPIGRHSRLLAGHKPRGAVGLDLTFARTENRPLAINGRVSLNNVGIGLTPVLADINQANGTILFHGKGLETILINAHLGESPITLQANLPDFAAPSLKLRIQGSSIRADELIFSSHLLFLRDLDGRLTIDGKGIGFDRVKVRLDGGTDCVVQGAMEGWRSAHVALNVDADYANIDEVIALWQDPDPALKKPIPKPKNKKPGPTVIVDVQARQGHINRLKFERATGTVASNGKGMLTVFPLQFHAGDGYGVGQVVSDSGGGKPTILKVSGHLENLPASGVHKEMLQRDSLVTGTLRGDFYLEGLAGEGFTRTASGGINMEIEDGVLRKFQFLSKVFSLLNVSQLLTLQLPDMATEGMPFKTTSGTFSLNQGLLRSEDLLVHSEAMDLSLVADYDILTNRINGILGVKPLKTVDKIITKIPIAGWLLTGEDKALVTAHFTIKGNADDPEVLAVPVTSLSSKVFGIFKRVLTLPGKVITDPDKVILPQSVDPKE